MPVDVPPELSKLVPAFCGSLVSLKWLPGTLLQKVHMLLAGTALSWFATDPLATWLGMNAGTTGFFLGVFGMALIAKLFDILAQTEIASTTDEWVRKTIGLPPRPPKD